MIGFILAALIGPFDYAPPVIVAPQPDTIKVAPYTIIVPNDAPPTLDSVPCSPAQWKRCDNACTNALPWNIGASSCEQSDDGKTLTCRCAWSRRLMWNTAEIDTDEPNTCS